MVVPSRGRIYIAAQQAEVGPTTRIWIPPRRLTVRLPIRLVHPSAAVEKLRLLHPFARHLLVTDTTVPSVRNVVVADSLIPTSTAAPWRSCFSSSQIYLRYISARAHPICKPNMTSRWGNFVSFALIFGDGRLNWFAPNCSNMILVRKVLLLAGSHSARSGYRFVSICLQGPLLEDERSRAALPLLSLNPPPPHTHLFGVKCSSSVDTRHGTDSPTYTQNWVVH